MGKGIVGAGAAALKTAFEATWPFNRDGFDKGIERASGKKTSYVWTKRTIAGGLSIATVVGVVFTILLFLAAIKAPPAACYATAGVTGGLLIASVLYWFGLGVSSLRQSTGVDKPAPLKKQKSGSGSGVELKTGQG